MKHAYRYRRGFTLIELMIAVAIVSVLAAVAMPSYLQSIRNGKRADGRALLQAASLAQEKYRLSNASYATVTTVLNPPCPSTGACNSDQNNYTLSISGVSGVAYTLTATAISSSQLKDTGCTSLVLTLSSTSQAGQMNYSPTACWSQ